MSLGWQTESALVPRASKPIAVDDKSILSLKALVYSKEQHLSSSKADAATNRRKFRTTKPLKDDGKPTQNQKVRVDDIIYSSLKAKADIYETLANSHSDKLAPEDKKTVTDYTAKDIESRLVDFSNKHELMDDGEAEIVDEFGRTKVVKKRSREYEDYLQTSKQSIVEPAVSVAVVNHASTGRNSWAWSTGAPLIEEAQRVRMDEQRTKTAMQTLVSHRIQAEVEISSASRVKSQWEKTLLSSSKEYLNDIHKQTIAERKELSHGTTHGVSSHVSGDEGSAAAVTENDSSTSCASSNITIGTSSKQARLELLRKKQNAGMI